MKKVSLSRDLLDPDEAAAQPMWGLALFVSASAGFLFDLAGISLCAVSFPGILPGSDLLNAAGTWLIAAGLPLIFFAAHCMDKIDSLGKHERDSEQDLVQRKPKA
ncbi:MAG: hypothetical protein J5I65_09215 [Aridibacter famidurans]|nr:hypothetical protein [Aridibacter famidurans]